MNTAVEQSPSLQREWWLRTLAIFQSPATVFAALRDDSPTTAQARQEPITAIVLLAGVSGVLSTTIAGRLYDDVTFDWLGVAVWAFLGGAFYGIGAYWFGGLLLHGSSAALGGRATYRQARHVLGFAAAPIALSLLLWPVRLGIFGGDVFRSGGGDEGVGDALFEALVLGFAAWALLLVVIGVRTLQAWSWPRALGAVLLAASLPALLLALSLF